jgi:hypothetical protein
MGSYLVLEFCDGGTLDGFIVDGPSSLHQAWSYFRDVLLALNYLHSWVRFRRQCRGCREISATQVRSERIG